MHGRLAAGLAIAAVAAAPAGAVVPSGNLLVNPGAEAGPGAPDDSQDVAPPGWNVESTFTAVQYGASGGFPTTADAAALGGGANFFAGGPGGATSAATQVVDVSTAAPEIDAGKVGATLGAALGGYASQTDHGTVTATFLNAAGAATGTLAVPTVTATDRNSVTGLIARSATGVVPAGTRQVSVRIDAIRDEGSYNDAYIDNVSLVLGAAPVPIFHKSVVVKVVGGKVGIRRPGSTQDVDLQGLDDIPLGSTVDAVEGVVELTSVARAGGPMQTARFFEGEFKVTQTGSITKLALNEPLAACGGARGSTVAAAAKKKRHLWGDGKGSFRTSGKYSSATVRGTKWFVQDSCAGTLTRVARGTVTVRDRVRHKTIVLHAGQRYVAKPRR